MADAYASVDIYAEATRDYSIVGAKELKILASLFEVSASTMRRMYHDQLLIRVDHSIPPIVLDGGV